MKIETKELIELFKTYNNGCSYKLLIDRDLVKIIIGCHHLTNLQTGVSKYLQQLVFESKNNELELSSRFLIDHPKEVELEILKSNKFPCKICGGNVYKLYKEL